MTRKDGMESVRRDVSVKRASRIDIGSCNACNDKDYVLVFEVSLSTLSFRLCRKCRLELMEKLDNYE